MAGEENRLKIEVVPVTIPAGVTHAEMLPELYRSVDRRRLPRGWEVDLAWRNPDTAHGHSRNWKQGDWTTVLSASTSGFSTALKSIIAEEMGEAPPQLDLFEAPAKPKKKAAEPKKKAAAKKKSKAKKKLTPKQLAKKRSAAARKGWATRRARANAAKKV